MEQHINWAWVAGAFRLGWVWFWFYGGSGGRFAFKGRSYRLLHVPTIAYIDQNHA